MFVEKKDIFLFSSSFNHLKILLESFLWPLFWVLEGVYDEFEPRSCLKHKKFLLCEVEMP